MRGRRPAAGWWTRFRESGQALFESSEQWRKGWKEIYGRTGMLHVLAREDGEARDLQAVSLPGEEGVPSVAMFARREECTSALACSR